MDRTKIAQKILSAYLPKGQEEIAALLGQDVVLEDEGLESKDREAFFDQLQGKQVIATIQVEGEKPGNAWCVADFRDAIRLGGTLIMLPEEEIAERISSGEMGEEEKDAFGEIVNLLIGVLSSLFETVYPGKLRMVKTGVDLVDPLQVAAREEWPFPEGSLIIQAAKGKLAGEDFAGMFYLVLPAELVGEEEATVGDALEAKAEERVPEPSDETGNKLGGGQPVAESMDDSAIEARKETGKKTGITRQKLTKILKAVLERLQVEVGGFLGHDFSLKNRRIRFATPEEIFSGLQGKQVLADIQVEGDAKGQGWLMMTLPAAIRLGGTLIMLPDSELQVRLASDEYGEEDSDAFGEIVNIVAGVYTTVFKDLYAGGNLRFVKIDQAVIDPLVIEVGEDYPVADEEYVLIEAEAFFDDVSLGATRTFFPLRVFHLRPDDEVKETPKNPVSRTTDADGDGDEAGVPSERQPEGPSGDTAGSDSGEERPVVVLCCGDDQMAETFRKAGEDVGFNVVVRPLHGNSGDEKLKSPAVRLIMLVFDDVGEKGLAAAIRINSIVRDQVPMIAAGPNWTRSMVLRAIKYGIRDILVTPADEERISEKIREHAA
ncbi:hypothetical protein EDC39_101388 [Geothermobacter ehrlichii]|uniref:Uncharacterized protein n=1 Tax=Geothermobacter ehrlichii TaxID=213224 RepID=A0A5D3WPS8_9BACT|nr:chemotaxis protein CheX [Geothermobacter ehrlichii]TYP00227.1 hypothetical protein EDC39_101388 [Geothermobacter ehrlichii]